MADPTTSNILLSVPLRGSDVGTWDIPVNSNSSALDGYLGGVQTISVASSPLTLSAPAGTVTATGGPTQAQNSTLVFTGNLTGNVQVTLPLPGYYIIMNNTTGNFVLSFRAAGSGAVIGFPPGQTQHILNDGNNVFFANLGNIAALEFWVGISSMPAWVSACSKAPYLLCDGTVYNFSTFPILGPRLVNWFGGNGVTTFGVPDLRGRVPLPFDATGRITVAGCGISGNVLGSTNPGGTGQNQTLLLTNLPPISNITGTVTTTFPSSIGGETPYFITPGGTPVGYGGSSTGATAFSMGGLNIPSTFACTGGGGSSTAFGVVQPSLITGIAVIRAA